MFKIALCLSFYVIVTGNIERFQYFNFVTNFLKNKNLCQKIGVPFLVENTKTKNATFLYKTALSAANIITNRIGSTKWTYDKERSFASNYIVFIKFLFQFKNLL